MKGTISRIAWMGMALVFMSVVGCEKVADRLANGRAPKTVRSIDGVFAVTVPSRWSEDRTLHEKADLGAANRSAELYVIVLSESKEDFAHMTVEKHSEITRGVMARNLKSMTQGQPTWTRIDGHPALQIEIGAVANNINVKYLHTTVEMGGYYHQILAWTLASKWKRNREELLRVVGSFRIAQQPTRM